MSGEKHIKGFRQENYVRSFDSSLLQGVFFLLVITKMTNPLGILNWPIVFILFYSYFIPISVYLNGNFNYYWDVVKSAVTEDESSTVYDFIVGKINWTSFQTEFRLKLETIMCF